MYISRNVDLINNAILISGILFLQKKTHSIVGKNAKQIPIISLFITVKNDIGTYYVWHWGYGQQ